ncbi:MAG: ATP-binding cassette domain-containing protein [Anaerolineae bacterium]|nr:ATP-binding cassette domain-containing protein [Anaerolineae bacterium]
MWARFPDRVCTLIAIEVAPTRLLDMTNGKPFITLDDIAIRLYDRVLFEHTDWESLDNQHWAVIGPNGSGKSTLAKALCGRVPVVQGRIAYHFAEDSVKPQEQIGYVTFDAQRSVVGWQDPFYQARWNSNRSRDGIPVADCLSRDQVYKANPFQVIADLPDPGAFAARRDEVIELLQIEALLEKNAIQLSNGERRKVFIAHALLKSPRLLILDNPFTGLDLAFRARLKELIARLMQSRMRVMVAETDRDEIPPGITHVLEVADCRVVACGPVGAISKSCTAAEGKTDPRHPPPPQPSPLKGEGTRQVLVHMENVRVSYNGAPVLQGIDWTVREGERWALLGPNGAGKTTLLSLILGDNPQAYANKIALFGRQRGSGESIWEIKRRIGWVAPELHLYTPFDANGFDVVCSGFFDSVGLYRRCSPQQREEAQTWMARLGISNCADAAFRQLSEGEQRMALVARALVKQPQLLVLDEPCQGLDAHNRDRVLEIVDSIGDHLNTSIIYVTHETDELPDTITHEIRLDAGRVVSKRILNCTVRD